MKIQNDQIRIENENQDIINAHKSITENYYFTIQNHQFIGLPNVISPKLSPSTAIWREHEIEEGIRFLEIGCGSGVFAILAALRGASFVTATDINIDAIENTKLNAKLHSVSEKVEVFISDIFNNINPLNKYDVILWNIPWSNTTKEELSLLEQSKFDKDFKLLDRYLSEANKFLTSKGKVLLGYSSTYGNLDIFYNLANKYFWNFKLLYQVGSQDTFFAELFELTKS